MRPRAGGPTNGSERNFHLGSNARSAALLWQCAKTPARRRCYAPARDGGPAAPVLVCPVGSEYVRSYNAIRKLCARLSEKGFPVLKFDYCGLGDSYGDGSETTVAEWRRQYCVPP